ncbi:CGI-121-domain-containing protein [Daldinia caldariorum]|uniref:CGI-121-domain-containing protein n=1 Tax=Daldinia caldariorum TaxID=326644 RepID=UPI0020085D8D|nr:CGI-121-domain-containing protein [Daldinia caldariorum]KAI1464338.1 CGI-121-domain-containing protein [Daldinia caldariorum]
MASPSDSQPATSSSSSSLIETIQLEHVPSSYTVLVGLFKDVTNAEFLQQQLLSRNAEYEYAFINASSVISRLQVLAAVYKAITIHMSGSMKTPNIHSEIVCSLSPNNNISEAYRRFGITPSSSKHLIIVKVLTPTPTSTSTSTPTPQAAAETAVAVQQHLLAHVRGTPTPFTDEAITQSGLTDWSKVRKYYKLNGVGWLDGVEDSALRRAESEMMVLGSMALRSL